MYRSLWATAVAGVLLVGGATAGFADEASVEMLAVRAKGPGPAIGTVHFADAPDGVLLQFDLVDLPPGPNRVFLQAAGDCTAPQGEMLSKPLGVVEVGITESGAEPLKQKLLVPGMTLAGMSQKSLIVYRGSQASDLAPEQPSQPRLVACGVIR
jgi:Cu/Zn superoxide dismutase